MQACLLAANCDIQFLQKVYKFLSYEQKFYLLYILTLLRKNTQI